MGCHLLSTIFLFTQEKYSHGLLPSLFFLVIVLGVALGKRNLLWDLLPDHIEEHVLEMEHAE